MSRLALSLALCLSLPALAGEVPDDPLVGPLTEELMRSATELSLPDAPAVYHLRYRVVSLDQVDAEASFGSVVRASTDPMRMVFVETRVGEPDFDNTGFGGWQNGFRSSQLPLDDDARAAQVAAWRVTDRAYKEAVEQFARKAAQFTPPEDYPGDYTLTGATIDDLGTAPVGDRDALVELARELSAHMAVDGSDGVVVERGAVHVGHEAGSTLLLDTEGTRLREPMEETTIRATLHVRAADGLLLTDQRLWTFRQPSDLPPVEAMVAEVDAMTSALLGTAAAPPLDEEYVGPVLFEDGAALDLFRFLLVPQLQGTPPEVPFDSFFGDLGGGSSDVVRLKRRVLPLGWSVQDDPERDPRHPASFVYDAEGVRAQAVDLVSDGIVRDLLMSRVPRKGLSGSNGHARGGLGERAQGRATLLDVEPAKHVPLAKVRKKALRIAASYGLDYVVVVRRLQDPAARSLDPSLFTWLDSETPQLPMPVEMVRVYADGHEERLRGAQFTGVQRFVLRDIVAAGPATSGSFMASPQGEPWTYGPTEGLPTWIRAPQVLVGEMELVPVPGDPRAVPVVPAPSLVAGD